MAKLVVKPTGPTAVDFDLEREQRATGLNCVARTMELARDHDGSPRHLGYVEVYFNGVPQDPTANCSAGFYSTQAQAMGAALILAEVLHRQYCRHFPEGA